MAKKKEVTELTPAMVTEVPITGEIGVVVFGTNTELKNAVADIITLHLQRNVGVASVERHEFHAPGRSHGIMQHEDSVLEMLERVNPKLMGARVIVAVDTIGQSLISTEDARRMRRFGAESITRTGEYNTRVKLADLVARTEDKIADYVSSAIRQAIEATESFTDADSQPAIVSELLNAITDGTAKTFGLDKVIDYAVTNVGMQDPRLRERISFRDMVANPNQRKLEVIYTNPGTDMEVERALRSFDPDMPQGVIDAYLGRGDVRIDDTGAADKVSDFQREMSGSIESMGGEMLVVPGLRAPVPLIGDVFDRMIRTKVQATLAAQAATDAEEACNQALETMSESLDRIGELESSRHQDAVNTMAVNYLLENGGQTAQHVIEEHAHETGLDPDVVALQALKNLQKRAEKVNTNSLDSLRSGYVAAIDSAVQDNATLDDTLEDLFDLAKQLPEGVSVRSSGAIISNNEDGPEVKLHTGNATYGRF